MGSTSGPGWGQEVGARALALAPASRDPSPKDAILYRVHELHKLEVGQTPGHSAMPQAPGPAGVHQGQAAQGSLLAGKCWVKWGLGEGSQHLAALAAKAGQGGTGWRQDTGLQGSQGTFGNARGWAPSSGFSPQEGAQESVGAGREERLREE